MLVESKKRGDKLQRFNLCLTELNEREEDGKPKVCDFETHRGCARLLPRMDLT